MIRSLANAGANQRDDGDAAQLGAARRQADHLRHRQHPARHLRLLLLQRLGLRKLSMTVQQNFTPEKC